MNKKIYNTPNTKVDLFVSENYFCAGSVKSNDPDQPITPDPIEEEAAREAGSIWDEEE